MKIACQFFFCTCFSFVFANAQIWIGVQGGLILNSNNPNLIDRPYVSHKSGMGISVGVPVQVELGEQFSIGTGFFYLSKNYQFKKLGSYEGIEQYFSNQYVVMPLMCRYVPFSNKLFHVSIEGGIFGGYWIYANLSGKSPNLFNSIDRIDLNGSVTQYVTLERYSQKYKFDNNKDNRWEFGVSSKVNLDYLVSSKKKVFLTLGYDYALTNQEKGYQLYQVAKSNRSLHLSMGILTLIKL